MRTQTTNLETIILGSMLLSQDRKNNLLKLLPALDEKGLSALSVLLLSEPTRIEQAYVLVLKKAVKEKNSGWLKTFDQYLLRSLREIRAAHEETSDRNDDKHIERLFDTTS